jgi:hypothetical protein
MTLREDVAVGWEALEQWGEDVDRSEPLTGGVGVNEVWSVRVNGHLAVGRLGQRSDADLAWETDLLRHLRREGMPVPVSIPTTDGRHFADGLVVMTYVEGRTARDRSRLASRRGHTPPAASVHARLAPTPGLAIVDPPSARRNRGEGRPRRDAAGGCRSMPSSVDATHRSHDVRCPRRPLPAQHPHDRGSRGDDRLGRVARRRPRPRPGAAA